MEKIMTKDEMFELANNIAENIGYKAFEALPVHLKLSKREDLNGFLLLDKICARNAEHNTSVDIISASEHDTVYLSVDVDLMATVIKEDEVHALIASGINFSSHEDCLYMFT